MPRYSSYGNSDDRVIEDLDLGFTGFNNRLRPDQLPRGILSSSINGRLDLNGEWQVRKGITNIVAPFTVAGGAITLGSSLVLPLTITGASVSTNVVTITTGTTAHGFTTGDKVVIEGLRKTSTGHADPNGEHTVTGAPSSTTFTFALTTTASSYPVSEGIVLPFDSFPADPVNFGSAANYAELSTHLFLPHVGGSSELTLNDATNTEITAACRFSDNSITTDEFIILSGVASGVAVNVNDGSKFNMLFEEGETVPLQSSVLQVLNKIIIFRNQQAALECKKFFKRLDIASAVRTSSSRTVTVTTSIAHGLETGDFVGIENLAVGNEDPNGSFQITKVDATSFTYQVANLSPSGTADNPYAAASGSFGNIVPTFRKAPSGTFTQPIELSCNAGEFAIVENRGVVHKNTDNYKVGDTIEFLGDLDSNNKAGLTLGSKLTIAKVFEEASSTTAFSGSGITSAASAETSGEYNGLRKVTVTAAGHGLSVGDPIIIASAHAQLDGDRFVAEVVDADNFVVYVDGNPSGSSGTVKLADGFEFFIQSSKTDTHTTEGDSYDAQPVFSKKIAVGMGFIHMPHPPYGHYHQKRLIVPYFYDVDANGLATDRGNRDELIMSDLLDTDTYDEVFGQFRFNAGTADFNVGMHSFADDILLVFNRNSIHLVANSLNQEAAIVKNLTNEVGCLARKSIIQVGNQVLFLSDNGIYGISFLEELNLRGNDIPLSEPIASNIKNINKENAHKATAVYFDNRYYIAVPMDYIKGVSTNQVFFTEKEALEYTSPLGRQNTFDASESRDKDLLERVSATENNVILVYNFLNKQWESIDYVSSSADQNQHGINENWDILDLIVAGNGDARGVYVVNSQGGVHRYDDNTTGVDSTITEIGVTTPVPTGVKGFAETRMFNYNNIDRKKFNQFEVLSESPSDVFSSFKLGATTENIDSNFLLKNGDVVSMSKGEDVAVRGRIGNKRAYGIQFRVQNTLGSPKFKGIKVSGAETFRSTNKAE